MVGSEENFQVSNVPHSQPFCAFSMNFQSAVSLNNQQLLVFLGFSGIKTPQKCNENTQKEREHHFCKLLELGKTHA